MIDIVHIRTALLAVLGAIDRPDGTIDLATARRELRVALAALGDPTDKQAPADERIEALRLAIAVRKYLARRGVNWVDGDRNTAERQAGDLEAMLARLILGEFGELPLEHLLSVALDRAEERGEYSKHLRAQVANVLPALRICTPWVNVPSDRMRCIYAAHNGEWLIGAWEDFDGDRRAVYTLTIEGQQQHGLSWLEVVGIVEMWLRDNGWVTAAEPPEEP